MDDIRLSRSRLPDRHGRLGRRAARRLRRRPRSSVAYVQQNGQFRQINQDPSYRGTDVLQMGGNLRLDRFLPTSLGLAVPVTVTYARTGDQPGAADRHRHPRATR